MGVKWLMLAARKRFAPAQDALGDLYWQGGILRQDRVRALMWYKLAEESAEPGSYPEIGDRVMILEAQVTESERADALARAKSWADKYPTSVLAVGMAE
jgi:TPR repeat protein